MESKLEQGTLTVALPPRINSDNAGEVERELFALVEQSGAKAVILDAAGADYISSAGLRVILKLKKAVGDSKLVNVSPVVYDTLSVTGFTEIIDVERAIREISVEGCEKIGEGIAGVIYRLDRDTIVKLYKKMSIDRIRREIEITKQAFIKGVPTAISYDIVKCGEQYGVVFELINSSVLAAAIMAAPERFDEYMDKYVALLKTVHSTTFSDVTSVWVNEVFKKDLELVRDRLTDQEWQGVMDFIDLIPRRNTMVHNDIHARNVMLQGDELLLIDMDDVMYGHPIFDASSVYEAYTSYKTAPLEFKVTELVGLSAEMCDKFLDAFLHRYFSGYTEEELTAIVKGVRAVGILRAARSRLFLNIGVPVEVLYTVATNMLREQLLPLTEDLRAAIALIERSPIHGK